MGNLFSTASSSTTTTPTKKLLSTASSSTTTTLTKKYDVFISFRGEDTRKGITSHLYDALCRKQIKAFIDNHELERGDKISPALLSAIEGSKIAVVIFSKDYASSIWCLRELVEIIRCKKIVMPVFYEVNASDVRKQRGSFEDSFAKHKNESQEEVQKWREALTEASNSSGWDSFVTRTDAELVDEIVEGISKKLLSERILSSSDFEGLVGIRKRIEPVISLLCLNDKTDVRIIGIWGMGGIGKTTLAEAIFKQISSQFEGACFIKNVGEKLKNRDGLDCLEREVLSSVLDEQNLKLDTPVISPFIKERLNRQQVFVVFDNVVDCLKLTAFAERLNNWFGLGSKIIIVSRGRQVLCDCSVNDHNIYEVEGLNHHEALKLFCNNAFILNHPTKDLMVLSKRIVHYAKGNPLALEVLGSSLKGKSKQEWESAMDNLKGIVNSGIFEVLKMSYDILSDEEKNLFLDIACFFKGYHKDDIAKLLDCLYYLSNLIAKSMITIEKDIVEMHDLLQEMGREIVYRESKKHPGKRSRLCKQDDVISTLRNDMGTEEVEGISLDMGNPKDVHLSCQDVYLSCQVFDKMHNLKFLLFKKNYNYTCTSIKLHLPNGLNYLPERLRILQWPEYPLRVLPSKFDPEKLVKLDLSNSNIDQLWEGTKHAPKLKWLILQDCRRLTRIPNLSGFLSLEEVDLTGCRSLVDFPSSVQQLNKLRYLSLRCCSNVTKIPLISASIKSLNLSGTAIEEVPSSIQSLTNLIQLDLSECTRLKNISTGICKLKSLCFLGLHDCSELEIFPDILETMEFLKFLVLSGTAIKELPPSIEHLNGLQQLGLSYCKNLETLPSSICNMTSLEHLDLSNCSKLDKLPDNLGNLKSLKHLKVGRSAVGQLPSSNTRLENLKELNSSECRGLTILPPLLGLCSLSMLYLNYCNLMEIPEDIGCLSSLQVLLLCGNMFESLPKSIKHLSKLVILSLRDCNMLGSITELPVALKKLEAINCKQLCQALPDASEFNLCIHSKRHEFARFLFINSFYLDQKAVSNVFEESLKGLEEPPTLFSIFLPGSEIPNYFSYQSSGSSVNIPVLRQALVNRKFMGFALSAILGFEKFHNDYDDISVGVYCHFETCDDQMGFPTYCHYNGDPVFINSDHILLWYHSFPKFYLSTQNLEKLLAIANNSDYVDISFEFKAKSPYYKVKCCAVYPIYAEPIEIIGATIEDVGETNRRRSGRSDDNEEQVEPHPKRICTQPN